MTTHTDDWQPTDGGVTPPMFDPVAAYDDALAAAQQAGATRCEAPSSLPGVPPCELPAGHSTPHAFLMEWRIGRGQVADGPAL